GRWTVVGVSTTVNALAWGARSTFALFYVAMLEEFAWGRGPTALGYSLSWLGFVVFAPVAGWLSDRWGTRTVVTGGGVILGAALALTGQVTSLAQYYLCFGLLGGAGIAGMLIPSTTIVTRWFVRARGTAMGVLSTGPGSAVVFYPLAAWLIAILGWRMALVSFGCIVAAATVLLALLYREPAAAVDRSAGGADTKSSAGPRALGEAWTLRRALRSVRLWAAFTMTALGVIGFQIMATHQVAHAADHGVPRDTVVWLFALAAGCMMAGNVLGGWLSDRVGRGWVFVLGTVVAILGILSFALLRGPEDRVLLLLYAVSGFGFGMRIAQLSTIPADVFAGPHLGAILGVVQAGGGLGGAIGPYLAGWLFDATNSYQLAFLAACVAVAGSAVAAWFAARPMPGAPAPGRREPHSTREQRSGGPRVD
ncbi:MAG TPA: MFS transporter, partial [Methylomirabilota bacterium]|nr:MFS transporter [Methylomirabilota bacterium]